MVRKSKSRGRKNRGLRRKRSSAPITSASEEPNACSQAGGDTSESGEFWYSEEWKGSRAGARASRGFHFQHLVGAWLASRLASGDLPIESLTPEGLDDLQLDAVNLFRWKSSLAKGDSVRSQLGSPPSIS